MRGIIKSISVALSVVFIFSLTLGVQAASLDDLYNERDQLSDKLQKTESASKDKQKEIKSLSQQIGSLESDIKSTENKIAETGNQVSETEAGIKGLNSQIQKKTSDLNDLKKKINASIVELYRFSSRSSWELIFSGDSLSDNANQVKYVEAIQVQVKSMYNKLLDIKEDLDRQKLDQEAKKEELDNLKARQEGYKESSQYQMGQKDKLLNMTEQQKVEYEQQAKEASRELAQVENQIRQIIASRSANPDGSFGSGPGVGQRVGRGNFVGIQGSTGFSTGDHVHFEVDLDQPGRGWTNPWTYINSGDISWPLENFVITQDYGVESDWYSCGYHMGIDIAGPIGSPVFAPADGVVVLNEYFGGYGNAWAMKVDNGPYVLMGHLR